MKLGILGTGHVAATLAGGWSAKHEVTLGSRDPAGKDAGQPVLSLAEVVNAVLGGVGTARGLKTEAFNIRVVY
jgi:predicted dinucleotide-binding enzyme